MKLGKRERIDKGTLGTRTPTRLLYLHMLMHFQGQLLILLKVVVYTD